jgi:hypothetical protein
MSRKAIALSWIVFVVVLTGRPEGQDLVSRVRALYEGAAYEDVLQILDQTNGNHTELSISERQAIAEYRALSLLAVDRVPDAERTIEQILAANPLYHLDGDAASPRLVTAVDRVRTAFLPSLIRNWYSVGKAAVDGKRYEDAITMLGRVVDVLGDRSLDRAVFEALTDVTPSATHFLDISRRALDAERRPHEHIFAIDDANVVPPMMIQQPLPDPATFARMLTEPRDGELEVIIGPTGTVQSARITKPIHADYDPLLLKAAVNWKYRPATKGGQPVTYRRVILIQLSPPPGTN